MAFQELNTHRLYEALAQQLEGLIRNGSYAPGEKLPPVRVLAEKYGVSYTVVRDAIRSLAGKGLVSTQQGVGTVVINEGSGILTDALRWALRRRQVTQQEVMELWFTLETSIAVLAAHRRTAEDLAHMRQILDKFAALPSKVAWNRARDFRAQFLRAIMTATHNRAILAVLEPMLELVSGSAQSEESNDAAVFQFEQYQHLYECIQACDAGATCAAMTEIYGRPWKGTPSSGDD